MNIKIVVFGVDKAINLVKEISRNFDNITLIEVPYYHPSEVKQLINKHQYDGDTLLFCAPIPYLVALEYMKQNKINYNKPMVFIPCVENTIYPFLFNMFKETNAFFNKNNSISIDYSTDTMIKKCLDSLDINLKQLYHFSQYSYLEMDLEKQIQFHYNLWLENKVVACSTIYYAVYKELTNLGVPTYFMAPSQSEIRQSIHRIISKVKNKHQPQFQIAVGVFDFTFTENSNDTPSYQLTLEKLKLQEIILDYVENIESLIHWTNNNKVQFITTRESIDKSTKAFTEIEILNTIKKKVNIPSSFGIGIGRTANEANMKAHTALSKAKSYGEFNCFIIESNGEVHGPIEAINRMQYFTRSNNTILLQIATNSELGIGTINKIVSFWINNKKLPFTAIELASGFGITLRSARRILNKLEQNKFAQVIGYEQPIGRGRPRNLYKLQLDEHL